MPLPAAFAAVGAWQLATTIAASAAVGVATGSALFSSGRSSARSGPVRREMGNDEFCAVRFGLQLVVSAAYVNGTVEKAQQEVLEKIPDELQSQYRLTDEQSTELKALASESGYIPFQELKKSFSAIRNPDQTIEPILEQLENVVRADNVLNETEKWFVLKSRLTFKRQTELPFFVVSNRSDWANVTDFVRPLSLAEVKNEFSRTASDQIPGDTLLTLTPGTQDELMSVEDLCDWDITFDKETEILEAMRVAGAKRVVIQMSASEVTEEQMASKVHGAFRGAKTIKVKGSVSTDYNRAEKLADGEAIEVEFMDGGAGFLARLVGAPGRKLKRFVNASRWLKHDPKIAWLVSQKGDRSTSNRVSRFLYECDQKRDSSLLLDLRGAVDAAGIRAISVNGEASFQKKLEAARCQKRYFYVEFHEGSGAAAHQ